MEEIREAAAAYYRAGERDLQNSAREFFDSMDANGDGKVSIQEFQQFTAQRGWHVRNDMFGKFDQDGDGNLDDKEVLTLYYVIKSRRPYCDGCGDFLKALFFTCVECRNNGNGNTFDLCSECYGHRRFKHEHSFIIDNYLLLEHQRLSSSQQLSNSRSVPNYYHPHQGYAYPPNHNVPISLAQQIPPTQPNQPQNFTYPPQGYAYPPNHNVPISLAQQIPPILPNLPQNFIYPPQPTGAQLAPIGATRPDSTSVTWHRAFEAFEALLGIGSFALLASTVCSIM